MRANILRLFSTSALFKKRTDHKNDDSKNVISYPISTIIVKSVVKDDQGDIVGTEGIIIGQGKHAITDFDSYQIFELTGQSQKFPPRHKFIARNHFGIESIVTCRRKSNKLVLQALTETNHDVLQDLPSKRSN